MFSIVELLPREMVEKLRNLEVEQLPSYVKYIKEVIKEKVSTLLHYKEYNIKTLNSITDYPSKVGLFWVGKLYSRFKLDQNKSDPLIISSVWDKDIFLFPTLIFSSQDQLVRWVEERYQSDFPFLYRDGEVYYYENFLPLASEDYSTISIFYQKLYPIL